MPKHAILVTWRNMENAVIPDFIGRLTERHPGHFHRLYFDEAQVDAKVREIVAGVPDDEPLKVYSCGHGYTGRDQICDHSGKKVKTVQDLTVLLSGWLAGRGTAKDTSHLTRVDMVSCLFGRSPDGQANSSPAAKLHQNLTAKHI